MCRVPAHPSIEGKFGEHTYQAAQLRQSLGKAIGELAYKANCAMISQLNPSGLSSPVAQNDRLFY
jgi:hypothetical protein